MNLFLSYSLFFKAKDLFCMKLKTIKNHLRRINSAYDSWQKTKNIILTKTFAEKGDNQYSVSTAKKNEKVGI